VNFRSEGSRNSAVTTKLPRALKLVKIQPQGDWMEVETGRKDIKTGWTHGSSLSRTTETKNASEQRAAPSVNLFNKFKPLFDKQDSRYLNQG
jgi:hypothetical protein